MSVCTRYCDGTKAFNTSWDHGILEIVVCLILVEWRFMLDNLRSVCINSAGMQFCRHTVGAVGEEDSMSIYGEVVLGCLV